MVVVDDEVKAYFKKFSTEAEPSEHFPLMELPGYDCEEKVSVHYMQPTLRTAFLLF